MKGGKMKKLIIASAILLSSCAYKAQIDSKSTMVSCVDKGLDKSTLIECSSTYADERKAFCEMKAKEEHNVVQVASDFFVIGPFRTENHARSIFIQRCLKNSGVEVYNAAY